MARTVASTAARTWLESGHLTMVVIEFCYPGSDAAAARWDFPIRYDGNGLDEMWADRVSARRHKDVRECIRADFDVERDALGS